VTALGPVERCGDSPTYSDPPQMRADPGAVGDIARAADGTPIAYWGIGAGPPLLLIAGQAVDHGSWRLASPLLGRGRRVVVFDHRGTGASGRGTAERYSTRGFAEDAVRVLDAAGIERADVLGHSMGGRVAQWLAVDRPERVGALVLAATSAGDRRGPSRDAAADRALRSGDLERIAPLFFSASAASECIRGLLSVGGDPVARDRHFQASRRHDAAEVLGRVAARTLVLHGDEDRLTPVEHARVLARRIPRARLTTIRGARHGVVIEGGLGAALAARFLTESATADGGGAGSIGDVAG
jgi:pimeloyl-ACP methyl ester carboxylesterase